MWRSILQRLICMTKEAAMCRRYKFDEALSGACVTLPTGDKMPLIGLGTWLSEPGEVGRAVIEALRVGYRHVDCAYIYSNEQEVGEALSLSFQSGLLKRDEVFITSKLWSGHQAPEDVIPSCQLSLKSLQLDFLDLYLVHWPVRFAKNCGPPGEIDPEHKLGYSPEMMLETWTEMEKLIKMGLVKAIGVSNFTSVKLKRLVKDASIRPAIQQVECHPYFQQRNMKKVCQEEGVLFQSYSPLGAPHRPPRNKEPDSPVVLESQVINDIAKHHNCSPAQVCISWQYQNCVPLLTKSITPSRITANLASKDIRLTASELAAINELDRGVRFLYGRFAYKPGQTPEDFWEGENV